MDNLENWAEKKAEESTTQEVENIIKLKSKKFKRLKDIMNTEYPEQQFLIDGLIPYPSVSVLSGYPGVGKTWIILYIAKAIAEGLPLFDRFGTIKMCVGIIEDENGEKELKKRFKQLGITDGEDLNIFIISQQNLKVDNNEQIELLINECKVNKIEFLIFDPFVSIHSKSENSAEEIQKVMEALQKFEVRGISVLFSHHHKKQLGFFKMAPSQALRGSSVIFGRVASHIAIDKKSEDNGCLNLVISQEKLRTGKRIKPFELKLYEDESGLIKLEYIGEFKEEASKIEKAKEMILEILCRASKLSRKEIKESLSQEGIGESTTDKALKQLDGNKIKGEKEGKEKFYSLIAEDMDTENLDKLIL